MERRNAKDAKRKSPKDEDGNERDEKNGNERKTKKQKMRIRIHLLVSKVSKTDLSNGHFNSSTSRDNGWIEENITSYTHSILKIPFNFTQDVFA